MTFYLRGKTMKPNKTKTAARTVPIAAVFTVMLLLCMSFNVSAESESATDISGFESTTAVNEATYYYSEPYSIELISGGMGKFEMEDFVTLDIDLYAYCTDYADDCDDKLHVEIVDAEDSGNKIDVWIWSKNGGSHARVKVKDTYGGASSSKTEDQAVDIYNSWAAASITISKTTSDTDGTKKHITVSVGSNDVIENWVLKSPEMSSDHKERKWNDIEFSNAGNEEIYVDNIDIDTGSSSTYGYNWTFIILAGSVAYILLAYWIGIWPFKKTLYGKRKFKPIPGK